MQTELGLLVGIGLSAACGFRIFAPLLVMSVAYHAGHLQLAPGFEWIGSEAAIAAFAIASVLEVAAYYVPWVDNLLDTIATPAAIIAGTIITASFVSDLSPFLRWSLALIAGGGSAAAIQGVTSLTRLASTATTGGLANSLVATGEIAGSVGLSMLAVTYPWAAVVLVGLCIYWLGKGGVRRILTGKVKVADPS